MTHVVPGMKLLGEVKFSGDYESALNSFAGKDLGGMVEQYRDIKSKVAHMKAYQGDKLILFVALSTLAVVISTIVMAIQVKDGVSTTRLMEESAALLAVLTVSGASMIAEQRSAIAEQIDLEGGDLVTRFDRERAEGTKARVRAENENARNILRAKQLEKEEARSKARKQALSDLSNKAVSAVKGAVNSVKTTAQTGWANLQNYFSKAPKGINWKALSDQSDKQQAVVGVTLPYTGPVSNV